MLLYKYRPIVLSQNIREAAIALPCNFPTLPPPCLTVGILFLRSSAVLGFRQIFDRPSKGGTYFRR